MRSLRTRLLLSHFGPVLIVIPLLTIALLYVVETRYALNELAESLSTQGRLVAQMTRYNWSTWKTRGNAEPMLEQLEGRIPAQILIWDSDGTLLNDYNEDGSPAKGTALDPELMASALNGNHAEAVYYSVRRETTRIDVAIPVIGENDQVMGVVQITQQLGAAAEQLSALRWYVLATLAAGMMLAGLLSFLLSRSLNRSLEQLTEAAQAIRADQAPQPVLEKGPKEVQLLAQTFNRMATRLQESESSRQILLRSVVHELGRPLGAIKAAAQVLSTDGKDPKVVNELSSGIDEQVNHLTRLVNDLALLAQSEIRELVLNRKPVAVEPILRRQIQSLQPRLKEKSQALELNIEPELPDVRADGERLAQILGNLLDNATKYTPVHGQIRVDVSQDASSLVLVVEDSGPGVEMDEQEQIFNFFYRSPKQTGVKEGMGIGLALARRLALAHDGELSVDQSDLGGARFELRLPL